MLVACPCSACSRASGLRSTPPAGLGIQSWAEVSTTSRRSKSSRKATGSGAFSEDAAAVRSTTWHIRGHCGGAFESCEQIRVGVRAGGHRHLARLEFTTVHPAHRNPRNFAAGLALDEASRRASIAKPFSRPLRQSHQHWKQISAGIGQPVLDHALVAFRAHPVEQVKIHKLLQPDRQDVARDPQFALEIVEMARAEKGLAQHHQGPRFTDDLCHAGQRAIAFEYVVLRHGRHFLILGCILQLKTVYRDLQPYIEIRFYFKIYSPISNNNAIMLQDMMIPPNNDRLTLRRMLALVLICGGFAAAALLACSGNRRPNGRTIPRSSAL